MSTFLTLKWQGGGVTPDKPKKKKKKKSLERHRNKKSTPLLNCLHFYYSFVSVIKQT